MMRIPSLRKYDGCYQGSVHTRLLILLAIVVVVSLLIPIVALFFLVLLFTFFPDIMSALLMVL